MDESNNSGQPGADVQSTGAAMPPVNNDAAMISSPPPDAGAAAPVTPAAPPSAAPVALSEEALQKLVAGVAGAVRQPTAAPQAPQPSMADLRQQLNVYELTQEAAAKLGIAPEAIPAWNDALQALVKQAITMAAYHTGVRLREFAPMQQFYSEAQEQRYREQFMSSHPRFKHYEPMLEAVYAQIKNEGMRFETPQEAFKEIAKRGDAIIAKLREAEASGQPTGGIAAGRKPSTVSAGGQSTGGAKGGQKSSTAAWLFGGSR